MRDPKSQPAIAELTAPIGVGSGVLLGDYDDAIFMLDLFDYCICRKIKVQKDSPIHQLAKQTLESLRASKCPKCFGEGFYLLAELGGDKQYARCDHKSPNVEVSHHAGNGHEE